MRIENLLVEIGTEELPPKALKTLANEFSNQIQLGLEKANLGFTEVSWYASPRRLAVKVTALEGEQKDKVVEKKGPAVSAAFDQDGNPTKAALGWARGAGIDISEAERLTTDKGEWLLHKAQVKGSPIENLLEGIVQQALSKLPIPKPMRWGSERHEFIRPVHTVCALYGAELIPVQVFGIQSSTKLQGHRFHSEGLVDIDHADNYSEVLHDAHVMADYDARSDAIRKGLETEAKQHDAQINIDLELLDEVTSLVEWPVVLTASFEDNFLQVPKEALIYTMKGDQKYFPLLDSDGKLLPKFAFVTNIESKDPSQIVKGNEKVIRPRLADAEFFFNTDKKQSLESRLAGLETVLFQKQLGTLREKSDRIANIAAKIAGLLSADSVLASRAGLLSKTDLMTQMVMEFPDVQGVMGMHYATHDGEDPEVALALNEQYMPRFAGDSLPSSQISCAVAIADKLDTLVGIFGIGQLPKGDKDPFALRRAAIGLLRIIVENKLPLDLVELIGIAKEELKEKLTNSEAGEQVLEFLLGRFRSWYQEEGVQVDVIQAVLARRPTRPTDFDARVKAVQHFKSLEAAQSLAAANKRVANILNKSDSEISSQVDTSVFREEAEQNLHRQLQQVKSIAMAHVEALEYKSSLTELASLREAIDVFFDQVMVMDEDLKVRANRLSLLSELRQLFLQVADISVLN